MRIMGSTVELSSGAAKDISNLASGANRADIALEALRDETLSKRQIRALKELAKRFEDVGTSIPCQESVVSLVKYKRHLDGSFELTAPAAMTTLEIGNRANAECRALGIRSVYATRHAQLWNTLEANPETQTKPGQRYHFYIPEHSLNESRSEQVEKYGDFIPAGVLALAEMCERINTQHQNSILAIQGKFGWVRAAGPGVQVSFEAGGVMVANWFAGNPSDFPCAVSVRSQS